MNQPPSELQKVRDLPLVAKALPTSDFTRVVVELRKDNSLGLLKKNILYFPSNEFSADQVEQAIQRLLQTAN